MNWSTTLVKQAIAVKKAGPLSFGFRSILSNLKSALGSKTFSGSTVMPNSYAWAASDPIKEFYRNHARGQLRAMRAGLRSNDPVIKQKNKALYDHMKQQGRRAGFGDPKYRVAKANPTFRPAQSQAAHTDRQHAIASVPNINYVLNQHGNLAKILRAPNNPKYPWTGSMVHGTFKKTEGGPMTMAEVMSTPMPSSLADKAITGGGFGITDFTPSLSKSIPFANTTDLSRTSAQFYRRKGVDITRPRTVEDINREKATRGETLTKILD